MVVWRSSGRSGARAQARRVPLVVAPGGFVFSRPGEQQLPHQLLDAGLLVNVDVGGVQVRVLGTDHPEQATDSALLEIWVVVGQHL